MEFSKIFGKVAGISNSKTDFVYILSGMKNFLKKTLNSWVSRLYGKERKKKKVDIKKTNRNVYYQH